MPLDLARVRRSLKNSDLSTLFTQELGWEHHQTTLRVTVDEEEYAIVAIAQKRGMVAFHCPNLDGNTIPPYPIRRKIERQITRSVHEHIVVFTDAGQTTQVWQWVKREAGRPAACREHTYHTSQPGDALIQKLGALQFTLEEEESLTIVDVAGRTRAAFDVDRVTRRFYDRFQSEHKAFLKFIKGIPAKDDREWYASLMLNRLMFVYFIQKKGFLDGDADYLRNRLRAMQQRKGKDKFLSFYRHFLLRLFHEGLGGAERNRELDELLGNVPYLNGGLFDVHSLEEHNPDIAIPDKAFDALFDFFEAYHWHLDERPLRSDNEINPDVLGYIFEKYVNQKQMGAYYTKEDITDYIAKNTIVPFLFDAAEKKCAIAFEPNSALWRLLKDDPDRYLYAAVRHGVVDQEGQVIPLPAEIAAGLDDVAKRGGWNCPAAQPFALPTETWREHVARRRRCLEIRQKLIAGEVHAINDLITLNLDIRQFAQDAIEECEGPELLRAFFAAITTVSILDPTCGSGAFLFAALNILEPLYEACLDRMDAFVEDLRRSGEKASPRKFEDFRKTLALVDKHPNERYFILKSIIIGNLFGVDIMEEAVEICKLRLFLKLVAQVETAAQIEPLPDIDFNIRAGNTLVGYTSLDEVRASVGKRQGKNESSLGLIDDQDERALAKIEEDAEIADRVYQQFRRQQTDLGGQVTFEDKQELRRRLADLSDQLDKYLAQEYGVDPAKERNFTKWRGAHKPFHWFVEFYGIMDNGGFDVIIGNPPYVELRVLKDYDPRGYKCHDAGNLYALMLERSAVLCSVGAHQGFIVPVSSISTDRYESLQCLLQHYPLHYSSFDDRPSRLFDGLEHIRLTIHLMGSRAATPLSYSTRYNKWNSSERDILFERLEYVAAPRCLVDKTLPKLTSDVEQGILARLLEEASCLSDHITTTGESRIFYSRKVGYFLQVLNFQPRVLDGEGRQRPPSEFKELRCDSQTYARLALCCLNSNLFYWFITVFSDCRHVNKREVEAFPVDLHRLAASDVSDQLEQLAGRLMADIDRNSVERQMSFSHDRLTVQCIIPKLSKPIIDEIDAVLGNHYRFTAEETDYLIHYDFKYRVGADIEE